MLSTMPDNSVDSIVTDPPYGLAFMGKKWDYDVPSEDIWRECLRVLKPGGHLLAFAGTRTQHRMAVRIEDAGFEIRDMIAWVYGSGFPKSHNLKDEWQGWGTALKPALEPITVARKPLGEKTVAANVLAHGTGGLNVDGCRVGNREARELNRNAAGGIANNGHKGSQGTVIDGGQGRWPANLIHDGSDEVVGLFPVTGPAKAAPRNPSGKKDTNAFGDYGAQPGVIGGHDDNGGSAARFFYCAKASKKDRDEGCEGLEERVAGVGDVDESSGRDSTKPGNQYGEGSRNRVEAGLSPTIPRRNHHPTVKPTALMRYLCRLVTPPEGIVLDPFMGSGSTGKAAMLEGFQFIGIERDADYLEIAKARITAS